MDQEDPGLLSPNWEPDSGPQRVLYIHETGFRCDDVPDLAAVHRALVADQGRNAQMSLMSMPRSAGGVTVSC